MQIDRPTWSLHGIEAEILILGTNYNEPKSSNSTYAVGDTAFAVAHNLCSQGGTLSTGCSVKNRLLPVHRRPAFSSPLIFFHPRLCFEPCSVFALVFSLFFIMRAGKRFSWALFILGALVLLAMLARVQAQDEDLDVTSCSPLWCLIPRRMHRRR